MTALQEYLEKTHTWIDMIIPVVSLRAALKVAKEYEFNFDYEFEDEQQIQLLCDDLVDLDEFLAEDTDVEDGFTSTLVRFFNKNETTGYLIKASGAVPPAIDKFGVSNYEGWTEFVSRWRYSQDATDLDLRSCAAAMYLVAYNKTYAENSGAAQND